jgi:hypothetical protein
MNRVLTARLCFLIGSSRTHWVAVVKAVLSIPIAAAILCCANIAAADPWGCKVFDAIRDIDCPPHPDYVLKRVYFFCGENPRSQFRRASGDCRREGIAFNLRKFSYHGLPAVTWNIEGRKSRAVLATGCYCIIDQ